MDKRFTEPTKAWVRASLCSGLPKADEVTKNSESLLRHEERRKDPSLEPYFSEMEREPLFVKNLESAQGDERDITYFSVTYGPDLSGAISMNFGPMNKDGGERRLNVAITRARHELRVFSSLRAEQFDLSRTQAAGVRDLKHFLGFAERCPRAVAEATKGSLGGFERPFEQSVAAALASKGWQVHTKVGASAFRVDLGIVHRFSISWKANKQLIVGIHSQAFPFGWCSNSLRAARPMALRLLRTWQQIFTFESLWPFAIGGALVHLIQFQAQAAIAG
jgi:hypothetical protein